MSTAQNNGVIPSVDVRLGGGGYGGRHRPNRPSTTLLDRYWQVVAIIRCFYGLYRRFDALTHLVCSMQ